MLKNTINEEQQLMSHIQIKLSFTYFILSTISRNDLPIFPSSQVKNIFNTILYDNPEVVIVCWDAL